MLENHENLKFLVGNYENIRERKRIPMMKIFSEKVMVFLKNLSFEILNDPKCIQYKDLAAFGVWCRETHLKSVKKKYKDAEISYGRGLVFHISPSNIPLMFAYSLAAGLLAGNINLVRVPSKRFEQVDYLCGLMNEMLQNKHVDLKPYVNCVHYPRDMQDITCDFSLSCDVRVIWGGDDSISNIRSFALKPKAYDVLFSDRYSICVINSDKWIQANGKDKIVRGFYNDTYLNDQNTCSSPKFVLWTGENVEKSRYQFWNILERIVKEEYDFKAIQAVNKLEAFHKLIEKVPHISICSTNNLIVRIWSDKISDCLLDGTPGGGFFVESSSNNLSVLEPILGQKCQTLSYFGLNLDDVENLLSTVGPWGVDRVVPIGRTLDFSLNWDGYDLIRSMSRMIEMI